MLLGPHIWSLGLHVPIHVYSYLVKGPYHGPVISLSPRVTAENKKTKITALREPTFSFGFIYLCLTAPNRVGNCTFKMYYLFCSHKMITYEKFIIMWKMLPGL